MIVSQNTECKIQNRDKTKLIPIVCLPVGENGTKNGLWIRKNMFFSNSSYVGAYWYSAGALIQKTTEDAPLDWSLYVGMPVFKATLILDDQKYQTVKSKCGKNMSHANKCTLKHCVLTNCRWNFARYILHLLSVLTFSSICTAACFILYAYLVIWLVWKSEALINDILLYSI